MRRAASRASATRRRAAETVLASAQAQAPLAAAIVLGPRLEPLPAAACRLAAAQAVPAPAWGAAASLEGLPAAAAAPAAPTRLAAAAAAARQEPAPALVLPLGLLRTPERAGSASECWSLRGAEVDREGVTRVSQHACSLCSSASRWAA